MATLICSAQRCRARQQDPWPLRHDGRTCACACHFQDHSPPDQGRTTRRFPRGKWRTAGAHLEGRSSLALSAALHIQCPARSGQDAGRQRCSLGLLMCGRGLCQRSSASFSHTASHPASQRQRTFSLFRTTEAIATALRCLGRADASYVQVEPVRNGSPGLAIAARQRAPHAQAASQAQAKDRIVRCRELKGIDLSELEQVTVALDSTL